MSDDIARSVERSSAYEAAKAGLGKEDLAALFKMSEAAAWRLILTVKDVERKRRVQR